MGTNHENGLHSFESIQLPTKKLDTYLRVRVMPGKSQSPFPHQQKPYVFQMKD